jgi:hypothetical protein
MALKTRLLRFARFARNDRMHLWRLAYEQTEYMNQLRKIDSVRPTRAVLARCKGAGDKDPLGLAHSSTVSLGGFLVIRSSLHIANETLFFAEFFEPPHHLLNRFARS